MALPSLMLIVVLSSSMPSIWVNDASTGTCTLPDGRTCKFNGSNVAQLSDGSSVYVGGKGPIALLDGSTCSLVLSPVSGSSTSAQITVAALLNVPVPPTGTVTLFINGVQYAQATLANGQATIAVPSSAFPSSGQYTLSVQYGGDGNYSPSTSASQTFTSLLASQTILSVFPASGLSTTASVTVSGGLGNPTPTGTVTILVNGVPYTIVPLVAGAASPVLPSGAFTSGSGFYTILAQYNGDSNYLPSSNSQTFHYTGT